jgi:hypothetical protein
MHSGASTYKCAVCAKTLQSERYDDMPVKRRSSMSDHPKKIILPERELVLPPVFDSNKYEVLSFQLETVHLNGIFTVNLIKTLLDTVHKLS